jgi:hypothetical protein
MAVNARGVVLLFVSLSAFAITSAVVFWPKSNRLQAHTVPVQSNSGRPPAPSSKEQRQRCDALETRYHTLWEGSTGCDADTDCVAEPRGGIYTALDGCARFGNRTTPHATADATAAEWLRDACSWAGVAYVDCGEARAQCRERHCVERPPEPLPPDWKRVSLPTVVSVFAPPDFVDSGERGDDSYVRFFKGNHRSLELHVDPYASVPDAGTRIVVDGHFARYDYREFEKGRYEGSVMLEETWRWRSCAAP